VRRSFTDHVTVVGTLGLIGITAWVARREGKEGKTLRESATRRPSAPSSGRNNHLVAYCRYQEERPCNAKP
jgi:hypothetical protein